MSAQIFQIITIVADSLIFVFIVYYLFKIRAKEKELERKERKIDGDYHLILDNALARERKILEDASVEANQIIAGAQYINDASKQTIDQALQKMVGELQKDALDTGHGFLNSYQAYLKQLATQSLNNFQTVSKGLELDLQKQIADYHHILLPTMEKELGAYKDARMQQTEYLVITVVQKASQEILNKSISLDDHHALMIQALEKAKKEGVFD